MTDFERKSDNVSFTPAPQETEQLVPLEKVSFGYIEDSKGNGEEVTAATIYKGTSWKVYRVLGTLTPFQSNADMRAFIKNVPDLKPWQYSIPEAIDVRSRIDLVTASLRNKKRTDGREALEIFLRALANSETTEESHESTMLYCAHCRTPQKWGTQSCGGCAAAMDYDKKYFIFKPQ